MTKILVDTNVLIYGRDQTSAFHNDAVDILLDNSTELYITSKIVSEYFAVCTKLGIKEGDIWSFYEELRRNTSLLYPNFESIAHFEELTKKYKPIGNRVFDMEIVSVMLANEITKIATANTKDFIGITEIELIQLSRRE